VVLLVAAIQVKDRKACSDIKIDIDATGENVFVDTSEVAAVLRKNNAAIGVAVENIPLALVEKELEKSAWIKDAQLFFDNNQLLTVKITERMPVARVFMQNGKSFYIDSSAKMLPLSDRHTARIPVFTSFPVIKDTMKSTDSAVLQDVKSIAQYVQQDTFWAAQVAQVDITPQHTYEVIPVLGDQVINLGNATDLDTKFRKLYAFYKQVWSKTGFEKYSRVDVQYDGQVVAVKRGMEPPTTDSLPKLTGAATTGSVGMDTMRTVVNNRRNIAPPPAVRVTPHAHAGPPKKPVKPAKRTGVGKPSAKPAKKPAKAVQRRAN
jgi:cell division protein FtsQ